MCDGAIDFRKLLREEKKKSQQQHRQQQQQLQGTGAVATYSASASATAASSRIENEALEEKKESNDTRHNNKTLPKILHKKFAAIQEHDVEAIDFSKLVQEEQNRAARLQREASVTDALRMTPNFNRKDCIVCSNPSSIFYVPQFLVDDTNDGTALMEWLKLLPENPQSSQDNKSSSAAQNQTANGAWTVMKYAKRRVALFDATTISHDVTNATNDNDTNKYITNKNTHNHAFFPRPLQKIVYGLVDLGIFSVDEPPNHILINEYHPGQGILAHTDGPAYLSRTATLSLGSDVLIHFTPRPNYNSNNNRTGATILANSNATITTIQRQQTPPPTITVRLDKGSLVIFEDEAYLEYCHGITDRILQEQVTEQCVNAAPHEIGTTIERDYRISLTFRHKKLQQA